MPFNQALRKNSHILWTISLIQDVQPDNQTKMEFTVMADDVIKTETINQVTLCLASELQRFRLMILYGISESDAIDKCEMLSNGWEQENVETLKKLSETKKLVRLTWKEFLVWKDYQCTINKVQKYYEDNREFKHDVDGRIRQELENIKDDAKLTDPSEQTQLLKRYLFEECAFQQFGTSRGFYYELYKTPMNKAMRRIKRESDFVAPGYMMEIYFTQFMPSKKPRPVNSYSDSVSSMANTHASETGSPVQQTFSESSSFTQPVFYHSPSYRPFFSSSMHYESKPPIVKTAEFIEKTLQLLPADLQAQAIEKLIKFTTQEIIPLSYTQNALKNY